MTSAKPEIARTASWTKRYIRRAQFNAIAPDIGRRSTRPPKIHTVSYRSKSRLVINNELLGLFTAATAYRNSLDTIYFFPFPFLSVAGRTRTIDARRDNPEQLLDNCEIRLSDAESKSSE